MAVIVAVDGPEKAGKTTLIRGLQRELEASGVCTTVLKMTGPEPSAGFYLSELKRAVNMDGYVLWDRTWASEVVYSNMLGRPSRFKQMRFAPGLEYDPAWWAEWTHGRAADFKLMMLGPNVEALEQRRDASDLDVDPDAERGAFSRYGRRFGWDLYEVYPEEDEVRGIADRLLARRQRRFPEDYTGPVQPTVLVVGESRNDSSTWPGYWLPFTTRTTTMFAMEMGDEAMRFGWTNHDTCPYELLDTVPHILAVGNTAARWVLDQCPSGDVLAVKHPGWALRWGKALRGYQYPWDTILNLGKNLTGGSSGWQDKV